MHSKKSSLDKKPVPVKPLILDSGDLFGGLRKIRIHHEGKLYQLAITRQNKLILTK